MIRTRVELWGGVECTVNRLHDRFFDQTRRTGHHDRLDDLDRISDLGIRVLRYPVLWERVAPRGLETADWSWTDQRLSRLRQLNIRPIVTLLHHGSGPRATNLLDPRFAEAFATFAAAVARRYPWIEDFTPINEPLTTARFSALYGHWYPHRRDTRIFLSALCHQTDAIAQAMRAIREITPSARLVQTEDAGRVYASRPLAYQADFENHRRWLTFDLLAGRVGRGHALYEWMRENGADLAVLDRHVDVPTHADVIGLNYYLTSDRYLDHRVEGFPEHLHASNGRDRYADVEAVRMRPGGLAGHAEVLRDAWHRYGTPVALTEVHAGCESGDQVRWLSEAWHGAQAAVRDGVHVRAVTAWALFGSVDWDSLLTAERGNYEPGAFDVTTSPPHPTALATAIRVLSAGGSPPDPIDYPGWWRRAGRLLPQASAIGSGAPHAKPVSDGEFAVQASESGIA
jgi:dTDP-4-dehydrorhamnose reductase